MSNWFTDRLRTTLNKPKPIEAVGEIEDEEIDGKEVDNHGYVVVNLTQQGFLMDGSPMSGNLVMPSEAACTHLTLSEALALVSKLHLEHGHVYGQTIRIYRLAPVPMGEIKELFDKVKEVRET